MLERLLFYVGGVELEDVNRDMHVIESSEQKVFVMPRWVEMLLIERKLRGGQAQRQNLCVHRYTFTLQG